MKNFVADDAPFASSRVGDSGLMVSEVDESDGSIALFQPEIAVLNNVSLDHKSLEELRKLFGDFVSKAKVAIWNADDDETVALIKTLDLDNDVCFGTPDCAEFRTTDISESPNSVTYNLRAEGRDYPVALKVPGRHNVANATAAIAAASALGVPLETSIAAMAQFNGLSRRFDIVGTVNDIIVIDDFGHNPDKISATLKTMKAFPGRVLVFFQPHGFGPLHKMGAELAQVFVDQLDGEDRVVLCDPVYFGGTVDRSIGSNSVTDAVNASGGKADHVPDREDCGAHIVDLARPGDRIVIMGARDDTLSQFAKEILDRLG